jgi:hypothetical protein
MDNPPAYKNAGQDSIILLGRIKLPPEVEEAQLQGYRVQAQSSGRFLSESVTDGNGRFLLKLSATQKNFYVDLRIVAPTGALAGRMTISPSEVIHPVPLDVPIEVAHKPEPSSVSARPPETVEYQVVNTSEMKSLEQIIKNMMQEGILAQHETAWINQDVKALDYFHRLALEAAEGEIGKLKTIEVILRDVPMMDLPKDYKPTPGSGGQGEGCFVSPRYPYMFVFAGISLALIRGETHWVDRSVSYYLSKAHSLNVVYQAAQALTRGELGAADFADLIRRYMLTFVSAPTMHGDESWDHSGYDTNESVSTKHRIGNASLPFPELPLALLRPRHVPRIEDLNLCELEWMNCAYYFWHSGLKVIQVAPPKIGSVEPNAVCEGYNGTLRLYPIPGEKFNQQGTGWVLWIGRWSTAQIIQWTPDWIEIKMPNTIPAGCTDVGWTLNVSETTSYINEMRAACQHFFGGGSISNTPAFLHRSDVALTVVGSPTILRFNAAGQSPQLVAEACTPVELEWAAKIDFCSGTDIHTEVSLLADGTELRAGLGLSDRYTVTASSDVTYTLRIKAFAGTTECAKLERTVLVKRFSMVYASVQGEISLSKTEQAYAIDVGSSVSIEVAISCKAPASNLIVTLTSSNPARFPNGTVTVQRNRDRAIFRANVGQECGGVSVQISAPMHQTANLFFILIDKPIISSVTPTQTGACTSFLISVTAECAGFIINHPIGTPLVTLVRDGQRISTKVINMTPNFQDPFRGPTKIDAEVPALLPGNYTVAVSFRGKTGVATIPLQIQTAVPRIHTFSANPPKVISCFPTAVQLSWSVENVTHLKIFRGNTMIANPTRPEACGLWNGILPSQVVDREVEYRIEASPPNGIPVVSRTCLVNEMHGIYSIVGSIMLTNKSNRDLYIWSVSSDGRSADLEALICPNDSTIVTIPECVRINLVAETTGDETEVVRSTYYWRWNLPILGRFGKVYPPQEIY